MLWYIIDGWNLIHKIPSVKNSSLPKRDFISLIKARRLYGSRNNRVTIVFDGKIDMDLIREEKEFKVIFSDKDTADEIILRLVTAYGNKKQIVVVSDDREVLSRSRAEGASCLKADEFLDRAAKSQKKKQRHDHAEKDISYSLRKKITDELRDLWLNKPE